MLSAARDLIAPLFIDRIVVSVRRLGETHARTSAIPIINCRFVLDVVALRGIYDRTRKRFLLNNDATPTNPTGELDVIPAASVVAGAPVVSAAYALPNCTPGAMALGKNDELGIACFAPETLIVSAATGQVLKTITNVGGADAIDYGPVLNRFYVAAFLYGAAANGTGGTPVLGVIDAGSMSWITNIPTTPVAHSVAVDPTNGYVYMPLAPTGSQLGTVTIYAPIGK